MNKLQWLICLCALLYTTNAMAQTNTYAPGHVYIYSRENPGYSDKDSKKSVPPNIDRQYCGPWLYGLCTKNKIPLTKASYYTIEQTNLFLKCDFDLYNAWGKFLMVASATTPLNDSCMLAYSYTEGGLPWKVKPDEATGKMLYYTNIYDPHTAKNSYPCTPAMALVYASGRVVNFDFQAVSEPISKRLIITKNGRQGVYNYARDRMILAPNFTIVKYISDSFFLGWNSSVDYKLIDAQGKEYKAPAMVYEATKINYDATIFGIGMEFDLYKAYNNKGILIDTCCKFKNGWNSVLCYRNVERQYEGGRRSVKYKYEYVPALERTKNYLLDTDGKPLLDPKENVDSYIVFRPEDRLVTLVKYRQMDGGHTGIVMDAVYNMATHKMIIKNHDSLFISAEFPFYAARSTIYYYDKNGAVVEKIDSLSATEKNRLLVYYNKYNWNGKVFNLGTNKGCEVIDKEGKKYYFDSVTYLNFWSGIKEDYHRVKYEGKWGVCKITKAADYGFANGVEVTNIIPFKYDEIKIENDLYRVKEGNHWSWIDTVGKILVGGKDFQNIRNMALPNGYRLAYESNNYGGAAKIMLIDSMGEVLYTVNTDTFNFLNPFAKSAGFWMMDQDEILFSNAIYNFKTREVIQVYDASEYTYGGCEEINGRIISLTLRNTHAGSSYKDVVPGMRFWFGNGIVEEQKEDMGYSQVPITAYFFSDARGGAGHIISEAGVLYK